MVDVNSQDVNSEQKTCAQSHGDGMARCKHNFPLAEAIFLSFMIFLFAGLMIFSTIHYLKDHHLLITTGINPKQHHDFQIFGRKPLLGNSVQVIQDRAHHEKKGWEHVNYHGDIAVYKKFKLNEVKEGPNAGQEVPVEIPTFKFVYHTNIPLHAFLNILNDPKQSMSWFALLAEHKYEVKKHEPLVYQEFLQETLDLLPNSIDLHMVMKPYLNLHDREFATHLTSYIETDNEEFDNTTGSHGEKTVVTFLYQNLDEDHADDNVRPICPRPYQCIRGKFDMVLRLTTHDIDNGNSTSIEMELDMDMNTKGSPQFLMNNSIMHWGVLSLHKLVKMCKVNLGIGFEKGMDDFRSSLIRLIPVKH
eukprot:461575_1